MNPRKELERIVLALHMTLKSQWRALAFLGLTATTYALFLYIPVRLTPGNDLPFQLSIMRPVDHLFLATLAVLNALLILMHWHIFKTKRMRGGVGHVVMSGTGGLSAVFASVLGTTTCSACVAGILGFLGTGSVLFVLYNRIPSTIAAIVLVLTALFMAARRLDGVCRSCHVIR